MSRLTNAERIKRSMVALDELELGVLTQADRLRIDRVRTGMRLLDEEQADAKGLIEASVTQAVCDWHRTSAMIGRLRALVWVSDNVLATLGLETDWQKINRTYDALEPGDLGER